ncbi:hypothetical protein GGH94_003187 [Coemansia aciculifera]|uniref:Uncharacterized protein n=1 Tax=Coemansia aciculifera TaxID=417176 RepID=A0A9W8IPA0_9FUNG|nr:hypothetical protein GGH94_003187 [Coemansia aciculifera]
MSISSNNSHSNNLDNNNSAVNSGSEDYNSTDLSLLGPRLFQELWLDATSILDLPPLLQLAFHPDRDMRNSFRSATVAPPFARILGGLGLFDPIPELPLIERGPNRNTFPVVSYSARAPTYRTFADRSDREPSLAEVMARDGSRIINSVGEAFGETTRWAVGNLFGQVRDAMDYIESRVHHDAPSANRLPEVAPNPMTFYKALKSDIVSNLDDLFPEPTDEERVSCRSYQISIRTMPDGSVETRKTVHNNDGTKCTTVTLHHSDPEKEDTVTVL